MIVLGLYQDSRGPITQLEMHLEGSVIAKTVPLAVRGPRLDTLSTGARSNFESTIYEHREPPQATGHPIVSAGKRKQQQKRLRVPYSYEAHEA